MSAGTAAGGTVPPSSSLIKSLLANKVSEGNSSISNSAVPGVSQTATATLGLSPTATALPGMNRVPCMTSHASVVAPLALSTTSTTTTTTSAPVVAPSSATQQQVSLSWTSD